MELARTVRPGGRVLGLDAASAPLEVARRRQSLQPWLTVDWLQGDALQTGLASASADGVVMAYGLRNLADPAAGLEEIHRLLRPGGRAGVLDFNRLPADTPAAAFQRFYLRRLVVPAAEAVGLGEEYAYLEQSLKRFPDGAAQEELARAVGFQTVRHCQLVAGQMGLLLLQR